MKAGSLLREMQAAAPDLFGPATARLLEQDKASQDTFWGDWFLVQIHDVLVRVVRDRGQVSVDVGHGRDGRHLWDLFTLLRYWNPHAELPPDDVSGLAEALKRFWPAIHREMTGEPQRIEATYGPPNAP